MSQRILQNSLNAEVQRSVKKLCLPSYLQGQDNGEICCWISSWIGLPRLAPESYLSCRVHSLTSKLVNSKHREILFLFFFFGAVASTHRECQEPSILSEVFKRDTGFETLKMIPVDKNCKGKKSATIYQTSSLKQLWYVPICAYWRTSFH